MISTNLLDIFAMFEGYHQFTLKYFFEVGAHMSDIQFLFLIFDILGSVLWYVFFNL